MRRTCELAMSGMHRNADDIAGIRVAEGHIEADLCQSLTLARERINDV